ncbi:LOW QUALITY PROTEIN: hypothetical protein HID58_074189, partial [Brassica napus]
RQTGVPAFVTQPSSLSVLDLSEHSLWLPPLLGFLNFKKDREFVGITVLFLDEKANSSGMTYLQLKLVISQQLISYLPYLKKSTVFLIYFFIYATLASVMDSSLPRIALTMVSGKKKILLLKKDRDNPVNSPFQAEQQMEANFSGSSSTSRHDQKINVGGRG